MIWKIAKREILAHLLSLRFSLSVICVLLLVFVGAFTWFYMTKDWMESSKFWINRSNKKFKTTVDSAVSNTLLGFLRRPSSMAFCAMEDTSVWRPMVGVIAGYGIIEGGHQLTTPWALDYYGVTARGTWEGIENLYPRSEWEASIPKALRIDWAFIVGVLGSLMAILFTYDAISGDREGGTLKLIISNPVSRSTLLLGKFFGTISALSIVFGFGWILSLLILTSLGIRFQGKDIFVLLFMVPLASLLYISLFSSLGLLISSLFRISSSSLVVLLMIWTVFVALAPGVSGLYFKTIKGRLSYDDVFMISSRIQEEINMRYKDRISKLKEAWNLNNPETASLWREYTREMERISVEADKEFDEVLSAVERARRWASLSPAMLYRYFLEALAGMGFPGYKEFVMQARNHLRDRVSYLKRSDEEDPDSPHVFWIKGGMSQKEITCSPFIHNPKLSWAIREGIWDIVIIFILAVGIFLTSYLAFMRADVR